MLSSKGRTTPIRWPSAMDSPMNMPHAGVEVVENVARLRIETNGFAHDDGRQVAIVYRRLQNPANRVDQLLL
jgi:hypothetical protein